MGLIFRGSCRESVWPSFWHCGVQSGAGSGSRIATTPSTSACYFAPRMLSLDESDLESFRLNHTHEHLCTLPRYAVYLKTLVKVGCTLPTQLERWGIFSVKPNRSCKEAFASHQRSDAESCSTDCGSGVDFWRILVVALESAKVTGSSSESQLH